MTFDPKGLRALLFDLDGTLIDSQDDIAASANALRVSQGLEPLPLAVVASYIGDGVEALVRKLLGPDFEPRIAELSGEFKSHYFDNCVVKTRLYHGVEPTLRLLASRGYKMAVVTNKPERISARILGLLGVGPLFGSVIGGNSCENKKPHPQPLLEACKRLGAAPQQSCMIGDSRVDIEAAANAGMPSLGILGGIGDEALLKAAGPSLLLGTFEDLTGLFQGVA
jgi:phosphoglycolate phosphatase